MAKTLYIDGCIKDYQFVSTEPIAIGLMCLQQMPDECKDGFPAKVIDWAWKNLVNHNEGAFFNERGLQMKVIIDEN